MFRLPGQAGEDRWRSSTCDACGMSSSGRVGQQCSVV
jgi:hypothetical protein